MPGCALIGDSSNDLIKPMFCVQFPSHFESVGRSPCFCQRGREGVGSDTCIDSLRRRVTRIQ